MEDMAQVLTRLRAGGLVRELRPDAVRAAFERAFAARPLPILTITMEAAGAPAVADEPALPPTLARIIDSHRAETARFVALAGTWWAKPAGKGTDGNRSE